MTADGFESVGTPASVQLVPSVVTKLPAACVPTTTHVVVVAQAIGPYPYATGRGDSVDQAIPPLAVVAIPPYAPAMKHVCAVGQLIA